MEKTGWIMEKYQGTDFKKTYRISQKIGPERLMSQLPTSSVRLIIV